MSPARFWRPGCAESRLLQDVNSSLELSNPEIQSTSCVTRGCPRRVAAAGRSGALQPYGGRRISTLYGSTDQYNVLLELDPKFQRDINALRSLFVQSSTADGADPGGC